MAACRNVVFAVLIGAVVFSCGGSLPGTGSGDGNDGGSGDGNGGGTATTLETRGKAFWGWWALVGSSENWYISDRTITAVSGDDYDTSKPLTGTKYDIFTYTSQSLGIKDSAKNSYDVRIVWDDGDALTKSFHLLKVFPPSGSAFQLYKKTAADLDVTGKVLVHSDRPVSRGQSAGGIDGIEGILSSVNNPSDTKTVTTDASGAIKVEGVIPGETYTVTLTGDSIQNLKVQGVTVVDTPVPVQPSVDEPDLGVVVKTELPYNFKASLVADADWFAGKPFSGTLLLRNVGTAASPAITVSLSSPTGFPLSAAQTTLGPIVSAQSASIPLNGTAPLVVGQFTDLHRIVVVIADGQGNSWSDQVENIVFKAAMNVNFSANNAQGYPGGFIITPAKALVRIAATVSLPLRAEPYSLALPPTSLSTDKYCIAVDLPAVKKEFYATAVPGQVPDASYPPGVVLVPGQIVITGSASAIDYYSLKLGEPRLAQYGSISASQVGAKANPVISNDAGNGTVTSLASTENASDVALALNFVNGTWEDFSSLTMSYDAAKVSVLSSTTNPWSSLNYTVFWDGITGFPPSTWSSISSPKYSYKIYNPAAFRYVYRFRLKTGVTKASDPIINFTLSGTNSYGSYSSVVPVTLP